MFSWIVEIFVLISVYFVLLTLALPLLRRYFRAEACAMLWVVPNCLYLTINIRGWDWPRWVIPLPAQWLTALGVAWLTGMIGVLGWKIFSHLRFRRWLLRGAEEVSDPEVLAVWQEELTQAREKGAEFTLVTSPQATTPMTIGLFSKSVRVVLPRRHSRAAGGTEADLSPRAGTPWPGGCLGKVFPGVLYRRVLVQSPHVAGYE